MASKTDDIVRISTVYLYHLYLYLSRHNIYYFRAIIPDGIREELHKLEYRRSMQTRNPQTAILSTVLNCVYPLRRYCREEDAKKIVLASAWLWLAGLP